MESLYEKDACQSIIYFTEYLELPRQVLIALNLGAQEVNRFQYLRRNCFSPENDE